MFVNAVLFLCKLARGRAVRVRFRLQTGCQCVVTLGCRSQAR